MSYARALLIVAAITGLCVALRDHLTLVDVAMLLLLGVVVVAARYHRGPSLLSCLASIAAFDFLFVPPYYSFQVHETGYLLTFAVMLVVALTMSRLTGVIREHALESERRGRQASAISAMTTELAGAGSCGSVLELLVRHINRTVPGEACALTAQQLDGSAGEWEPVARDLLGSLPESAAARMAVETGHSTGPGTGRCDDSDLLIVPLRVGAKSLGLVAIRPAPAAGIPAPDALATAEALAAEGAIALERALLAEQNEQARAEAQAERLRTSLLSSLSHDFRTPLATIEGAASGLLEEDNGLTAEGRQDLAETILAESHRMTRMVHNLLNMIRVETGALAVQKSWQPLEEALGVALLRLDEPLKAHAVSVELPPDLPLVPIDELLIEQVFINLLENAVKYTPPGTRIAISACRRDAEVLIQVADAGPGIPPGSEETVFRKFYRAPAPHGAAPAGGAGLGLTISRGIVTAHGGRMWVEPHAGAGAQFRFTVPLTGPEIAPVPAALVPVQADG